MVELLRIQRAIKRRDEIQILLESFPKRRAEAKARLEEIMKSIDPEVELKTPYVDQEIIDEIMRLRQSLMRSSTPEGDPEACEQMNLLSANQSLDAAIALAWQVPGLLKQVKILDGKIKALEEQLSKPFDARVKEQVDEVNKLRGEQRKLQELRWTLVQRTTEILGYYDDPHALNKELAEKGVDAVRTQLVEKLKEFGKPRSRTPEEEEAGTISYEGPKLG